MAPDSFLTFTAGNKIKNFYFGNEPFGEETKLQISRFHSDLNFFIQHYRTAELIAKYQQRLDTEFTLKIFCNNFYLFLFSVLNYFCIVFVLRAN